MKIHQVEPFGGPCESSIKPPEVFHIDHLLRHISLVEKDHFPLSPLGLMAGDCIGELHLQGVEERVFPDFQVLLSPGCNLREIFKDIHVQLPVLFLSQRCGIDHQAVEDDLARKFQVIVVGKPQHHIGKPEPVTFLVTFNLQDLGNITVGNKIGRLVLIQPEIVIFHHHNIVSLCHFLLPPQDPLPDPPVELVCTFIGARHHDDLVPPEFLVGMIQLFKEILSG